MCSIVGYCGRVDDFAAFKEAFDRTLSRGPDDSRIVRVGRWVWGFSPLKSWVLPLQGMQL